ncbi:hypothetical protein U8527_04735 [Kordia algicida OT-1]|uniref:DUF2975 domain-containing protein n=1 Tax=Kordia algicida OT-1 TaxID=391587 RepID=A9DM51_9FLAO|nr:hypothetical protein [Kordia algicida]EDP97630.1 hypothetical protein KAOT1_20747 [Kordia algicida OT-1]
MRFFKIIATLIGIISFGVISYFSGLVFIVEKSSNPPVIALLYLIAIFVFSALNLIYHFKSYHFYKKTAYKTIHRKFSKLLMGSAIVFNCLLIFLFGLAAYDYILYFQYRSVFDTKDIFIIMTVFVFSVVGFLEMMLLTKRIKTVRQEVETQEEIENIGS